MGIVNGMNLNNSPTSWWFPYDPRQLRLADPKLIEQLNSMKLDFTPATTNAYTAQPTAGNPPAGVAVPDAPSPAAGNPAPAMTPPVSTEPAGNVAGAGTLGGGTPPASGFKWNADSLNTVVNGIGVAGNLGLGIGALINATQAFNFQRDLANRNLENQAMAYNTAMEDRIKGRYSQGYYDANKAEIDKQIAARKTNGAKVG